MFAFLQAQEVVWQNPNYKSNDYRVSDTIKLSDFGIIQEKFQVINAEGQIIPKSDYTLDLIRNEIYFSPIYSGEKITITYFVNPQLARSVLARRDSTLIVTNTKKVD